LYTALQQSTIHGAENNPPSFYSNRHFEVCKHLSLDEHTMVPDLLLISEEVWQELPRQIQGWLQEAAEESSRYQRELWQKATRDALQAVQEHGVSVYRPDKAPFAQRVQEMHASYEGTSVGRLLERIREIP
jgi:TRAP-type C4-dicarboxylate transport system substrate-binding protein